MAYLNNWQIIKPHMVLVTQQSRLALNNCNFVYLRRQQELESEKAKRQINMVKILLLFDTTLFSFIAKYG